MKQPFFSIITPLFNGEMYVHDYLRCLASQTFLDWEAIVVDDASTDNGFLNLLSLTKHDSRFVCLKSSDYAQNSCVNRLKGPYYPRNISLGHARGRFLCFLDIDDYWSPLYLATYHYTLISNPSLKLICSGYYKCDARLSTGYKKPCISFLPLTIQILFWNPIPNLTACVDASLAKRYRFEAMPHEDYVYWHRLMCSLDYHQVLRMKFYMAFYRSSTFSFSSNKLVALRWWIQCYSAFGYSRPLSFFLLLVKVLSEALELLTVSLCPFRVSSVLGPRGVESA
jgi:teichuronic acid biosynthesis glycosyltransferase TuaG